MRWQDRMKASEIATQMREYGYAAVAAYSQAETETGSPAHRSATEARPRG